MLFGATSGIIRGVKTPVLFSLLSGFQWFGISSVFYGIHSPCPARPLAGSSNIEVIVLTSCYRHKKTSNSKVWPGAQRHAVPESRCKCNSWRRLRCPRGLIAARAEEHPPRRHRLLSPGSWRPIRIQQLVWA